MITEFLSVLAFWGQTLVRRFFPLTGAEECHYINGPETLPPPLTKEEEARVMDNIRSGAPGAREPTTCGLWSILPKNSKVPAQVWRT